MVINADLEVSFSSSCEENSREEELACDGNGNFVIQRLLDHIADKEEFVKIGEKLAAITEDILSHGCTGVVLSLLKTCVRYF